jgi:BirA family biotin operon repressor/biotin-[acetyl-CoA-carboxylase] ligase
MSPGDPLAADALRAALGKQLIGREIVVLDETTSTNDVIAQMAPDHDEGLVVIAERQTGGRGQYGRGWESARGKGLWLSILLRPHIAVADSARITNFLARAIVTTISEKIGLATTIKPPNDVYIGARKVAGVLVEMRVEADGEYCAIAGLGLNVNQADADFPPALRESAGSLALLAGHPFDRCALAVALLRILNDRYREFRA